MVLAGRRSQSPVDPPLPYSCPLAAARLGILKQTAVYPISRKPNTELDFLHIEARGGNTEQLAANRAFSAC